MSNNSIEMTPAVRKIYQQHKFTGLLALGGASLLLVPSIISILRVVIRDNHLQWIILVFLQPSPNDIRALVSSGIVVLFFGLLYLSVPYGISRKNKIVYGVLKYLYRDEDSKPISNIVQELNEWFED